MGIEELMSTNEALTAGTGTIMEVVPHRQTNFLSPLSTRIYNFLHGVTFVFTIPNASTFSFGILLHRENNNHELNLGRELSSTEYGRRLTDVWVETGRTSQGCVLTEVNKSPCGVLSGVCMEGQEGAYPRQLPKTFRPPVIFLFIVMSASL
ncbi:hypothetical protein J6590_074345 [Homalodisca vitripennis]|nr:hypothetical protein J6590_074345 [Homalodisca vitripennis]